MHSHLPQLTSLSLTLVLLFLLALARSIRRDATVINVLVVYGVLTPVVWSLSSFTSASDGPLLSEARRIQARLGLDGIQAAQSAALLSLSVQVSSPSPSRSCCVWEKIDRS